MTNIFDISHLAQASDEVFETLVNNQNVVVERIVSLGQTTPAGLWYQQSWDEWVLVLQGEAELQLYPERSLALKSGDYHLIPEAQKHRVIYTSSPCIWLAIHWVSQDIKDQSDIFWQEKT